MFNKRSVKRGGKRSLRSVRRGGKRSVRSVKRGGGSCGSHKKELFQNGGKRSIRRGGKRSIRRRGGGSCGSHKKEKNGGFIRSGSVQKFLKSKGSLSKN